MNDTLSPKSRSPKRRKINRNPRFNEQKHSIKIKKTKGFQCKTSLSGNPRDRNTGRVEARR